MAARKLKMGPGWAPNDPRQFQKSSKIPEASPKYANQAPKQRPGNKKHTKSKKMHAAEARAQFLSPRVRQSCTRSLIRKPSKGLRVRDGPRNRQDGHKNAQSSPKMARSPRARARSPRARAESKPKRPQLRHKKHPNGRKKAQDGPKMDPK